LETTTLSPRERIVKWIIEHKVALLAFFVPALILQIGFIALQLFPFGKNTILTIDMYHQYAPFFSILREKLLSGGSLFYSWDSGAGTNFWGLIGYYLASPLNALVALFPRSMLTEAMAFITIVKTGCMGLFFHFFLKGVFKKESLANVIFACMYALCNYMVAYTWNIMWMDGLALLPLVMLGLERMLKGGRPWLYCISLGLTIMSNFYIALMVAVYAVLYFFAHLFVHKDCPDRKLFWSKTGRFTLYSLISGGLSAFMAVPTYIALQGIASLGYGAPQWDASKFDMIELLAQHLSFIEPSVMSGLPNVACSTLALMMVPVYWTGKSPLREKIAATAILGVVFLCFQSSYLNYAMHGMRYPNSLDHRFAFLYCFTLVVMAWRGFTQLEQRQGKMLGWLFAGMMAIIVFAEAQEDSKITMVIAYANILMVAGYLGVLALYRTGKLTQTIAYTLVLFLVGTELVVQWPMYRSVASRETDYVKHNAISSVMNQVEELDEDVYRVEKLEPYWTSNDCAWFGYKGISQFNSMAYGGMAKVMRKLGFSNNGLNSFFQDSSLPTINAILGVRYLVNNADLESGSLYTYETEIDGYKVFRNPYALSLGYMTDSTITSWNISNNNTFALQNQFLEKATGMADGPLVMLDTSNYQADGVDINSSNVTGEWLGGYHFDRHGSANGYVTFDIDNPVNQPVFLYISTKNSQEVGKVIVTMPDGESRDITYGENHVLALGECDAGTISVEMTLDSSDSGYFMASACTVDEGLMEEAFGKLSMGQWEIETFKDTYLSGTITAQENGVMFMSIPYDKGWTVKVDGVEVEKQVIGEGFMGIAVTEGSHTVEMSYCPSGFKIGLAMTIMSLALLVVIELLRRRRERTSHGAAFVEHVRTYGNHEKGAPKRICKVNEEADEAMDELPEENELTEENTDGSDEKENDQHTGSSL